MKSRYIALIATLFVASCESSYDDAGLQSVVQDVEQNQSYLTQDVENLKKSIAALEARMMAGDAITNIAEIVADGEVVGYTLTFGSGETLDVMYGENGENGDKGATGDKGQDGDNAVDGDKGATGDKGDAGADGSDKNIAYTYVDGETYVTITLNDPEDEIGVATKEFKFMLSSSAQPGATEVGDISLSLDGAAVGAEKIKMTGDSGAMTIKLPEGITSAEVAKIKAVIYGEDGTKSVGILPNGGDAIVAGDWNMTFTPAVFDATSGVCTTQPTLKFSPKSTAVVDALLDVTLICTSGVEKSANVAINYDVLNVFKVSASAFADKNVPADLVGKTDWFIKDCTTDDDLLNIFTVVNLKTTGGINLTIEDMTAITKPCAVMSNCAEVKSLSMPDLTEITVPNILANAANLESLLLPELKSITAGYFCKIPASLKVVYMPKLEYAGPGNFTPNKPAEPLNVMAEITIATDPGVEKFVAGNAMNIFSDVGNATLYVGKKAVDAEKSITVDLATGKLTLYTTTGIAKLQQTAFKSIVIVDNTNK